MEKRKRKGKEVSVEEGEDDKFCLQNSFSIMSCIHNTTSLSVIISTPLYDRKCSFFRYLFVPHSFFVFFLLFNSVKKMWKRYIKKIFPVFLSKDWMKTGDELWMQFCGQTNALLGLHFGLRLYFHLKIYYLPMDDNSSIF